MRKKEKNGILVKNEKDGKSRKKGEKREKNEVKGEKWDFSEKWDFGEKLREEMGINRQKKGEK